MESLYELYPRANFPAWDTRAMKWPLLGTEKLPWWLKENLLRLQVWRNNTPETWDGFKGKSDKTDKHRGNIWVEIETFNVYWSGSVKTVISPASHNSYPPTHTSSVQSLQLRTSCVLLSCNKKSHFCSAYSSDPIHTHCDHLTHPCLPGSDFPKQAERTKVEPHFWQGYSDMNGELSEQNQFP